MDSFSQLTFIKKEKASEHDAFSFFFERPGNFDYKPGQYLRLMFKEGFEDERGRSRFFSISSSPSETDHLMITTRIIHSPFKKTLANLKPFEKIDFRAPFGKFIFDPQDIRPRVFIAGGIGITPFRSMIKYIADENISVKTTLFASYSLVEDIIYQDELEQISKNKSTIQIVTTITKPEESKTTWIGETGRINSDMIKKYISDFDSRLYFIAGPEGLVTALKKTIAEMGIKDDMITIENFPGY